jgi:histidine triad (HIT) family protein
MDAPPEVVSEITLMVQRLAQGMQEALGCDGINIFSNNGKAAQQTIFHFSFHIIPRWNNDNIRMLSRDSQLSSPADSEELKSVAQEIRSKVKL